MSLVQFHLKRCHARLSLATIDLQDVLRIAEAKGYESQWLDAIGKALANNQETQRQVANIASLIHPPTERCLLDPRRKED